VHQVKYGKSEVQRMIAEEREKEKEEKEKVEGKKGDK
jgi:hypothetical protein